MPYEVIRDDNMEASVVIQVALVWYMQWVHKHLRVCVSRLLRGSLFLTQGMSGFNVFSQPHVPRFYQTRDAAEGTKRGREEETPHNKSW